MTIGGKIRQLRKEEELTQTELGIHAGITDSEENAQSMISQYERGANKPTGERLEKLEEYFGQPLGEESTNEDIAEQKILSYIEDNKPKSYLSISEDLGYPTEVVKQVLNQYNINLSKEYAQRKTAGINFAADMIGMIDNYQKSYKDAKQTIEKEQNSENDFIHKVEFMEVSKLEKLKEGETSLLEDEDVQECLYTLIEFSKSRKRRREAKERLELLKPVIKKLDKHRNLIDDLKKGQTEAHKYLKTQENRSYKARERFDLFPDSKSSLEDLKQSMEQNNATGGGSNE